MLYMTWGLSEVKYNGGVIHGLCVCVWRGGLAWAGTEHGGGTQCKATVFSVLHSDISCITLLLYMLCFVAGEVAAGECAATVTTAAGRPRTVSGRL